MDSECEKVGIGLENDAARFLGTVTFHVVPSDDFESGDTLSVEAKDRNLPPIIADDLKAGIQSKFSFHTCFFPEGAQTFRFVVRDDGGAVRKSIDVEVDFARPNDLSLGIRRFLDEQRVPWGYFGASEYARYQHERLPADSPLRPWFDRPDAPDHIERLLSSGVISEEEARLLNGFVEDGIIVLEHLIDDALITEVNREIDEAIAAGYQNYKYGSSQRIEHLQEDRPHVRRLWLDPRHRRIGDILFGHRARPCQTLTYVFGSEQTEHQDTIHLTPFPPGYMYGTWIALQDIQPDSGELIYYPKSHREPRVYMHTVDARRPENDWTDFLAKVNVPWQDIASRHEKVIFRPRKGAVAIWHENLLHGGSVRNDPTLERRSIVIHAFADGCISIADSGGFTSTVVPNADLEGV